MLGGAAEYLDDRHGDKRGGEDHEDAGLDALECPVPASWLVTKEEPAVAVRTQAGKDAARVPECRRLARGRHVGQGDGQAVEADGNAYAVGLAGRYQAVPADEALRDQPGRPFWQGRGGAR